MIELPERRSVVVEHQLVAVECGGCGQVSEPVAPGGVSGRVQYGAVLEQLFTTGPWLPEPAISS
ncbi:hypothetical protein [Micromonospora craniellae]|uniref:hypothetical protein n=1 Tax=Micromonospora craniellae TaxID=2294034 RepID=UPI0011C0FF88|nr:hypothetical protein [Micromonospora craniellae]